MKRTGFALAAILMLVLTIGLRPAWSELDSKQAAQIKRGKYLVERVTLCVQCHSSRNEKGELVEAQLLHGAAIPVKSPYNYAQWAVASPNIAGLRGYSEEEGIRLLTKGITRKGSPPRAPMPPYRLSEKDARAVVTYLKSLP